MTDRRRPNPLRWLWYAIGGRLPERHRTWVLHDVTARTWLWRHAARAAVLLLPLMLVWLLLPGPLTLRLSLVLMAGLVGFFYSLVYAEESGENRLRKHGYPYGTGRQVRRAAKDEAERAVKERYIARYRQVE
ncbi:DUF5313 family protein [Amycolatopsis thermophila]|uniref:DUF5313 domain-containing protein n=1 Tax=Amycolatopsis thermophila TaxID=206084 RepID=A0ABU0F3H9_9PSEU|nr:DUF5313 family protein [Amycolatopsis thermophila]MDQ0381592.1 hypothetical protein [Amycolatopsis thermophila]